MREKDVVANIATVFTMLFKVLIFGAVMVVFTGLNLNWFWYLFIILTGSVWVLGLQNVMLIYHMFRG
jgi:hypothetical protein